MAFNLVDASYDAQAQRAYVLLRDTDEDGEEMVVSLTFSYRTFMPLPFKRIQKEIVRKAGKILLQAAKGL